MNTKNKMLYIYILLISTLFILNGCSNSINFKNIDSDNTPENHIVSPSPEFLMRDVDLYFASTDDVNLYKENINLSYKPGELEESILSALKKGPRNRYKFLSTLAPHIDTLGINIIDNTAFINLSSNNLFGGIKEESMLIASIVKSFTQIDYIDKVFFLVDGTKQDSLMGNISINESFTEESADLLLSNLKLNTHPRYYIKLWFPAKSRYASKSTVFEYRMTNREPNPQTIIGNLLLGPTDANAMGCIPTNVEILDIEFRNHVAYINFSSKNLYMYKNNTKIEQNLYYSIAKSLLNLPTIHEVVYLVDGKKGFKLMGNIPIYRPVTELSLNLNFDNFPSNVQFKHKITLYYPSASTYADDFVKIEKYILHSPSPNDIIYNLTEIPTKKSVDDNFKIPYIKNIWQSEDIVYINFSGEDIELYLDDYKNYEFKITASIIQSLFELDNVNKVMFLVDGKIKSFFMDKIPIDYPLDKNFIELYKSISGEIPF